MSAPGAAGSGGFSVRFDRGDGFDLRTIRWGADDVVERIYVAVRDVWWRTVPLRATRRRQVATADGFEVEVTAVTESGACPLRLELRYRAAADTLTADFRGTALGDFEYARIGLCVLLSDTVAEGRDGTSWDGTAKTSVTFPREIITPDQHAAAADAFHRPFTRLAFELPSGLTPELAFEGERFQFEDQRNWTDPSYKIYSAAPAGGPPLIAQTGLGFSQQLRIGMHGAGLGVNGAGRGGDAVARSAHGPTAVPHGPTGQPYPLRVGRPIGHLPSIAVFNGRESAGSHRPVAGFRELNATRPAPAVLARYDAIELGVNGSVHAADDDSVMGTARMHGRIAAQVRERYPDLPLVLAPISFADVAGDWRDERGAYVAEPPSDAPDDPRWRTEFGAAWVIASVAVAAVAEPVALRYFGQGLSERSPAAEAMARLAALAGRPIREVSVPLPLQALAIVDGEDLVVAVANTGPDLVRVALPDGSVAVVGGFTSQWRELPAGG